MMDEKKSVIEVENLSKLYRLGQIGTGTISHDLNRWYAQLRGKEDPYAKVGSINDRKAAAQKGESVWALRDINLSVQQGEVLGIIGKNGAGKSTLLKLLSRITSPTSGSIKIKGRVASLLEVGTGFHPEMTGRENIYMNGTIMGMKKREIDTKLDDIVGFAGIAKYLDTPVKRYSSGMTVRLGFSIAAFLEPEILIVDEVLAVGDAEFQKMAVGKMKDVSSQDGRTVLFVSHNMVAVRSFCSRGLLLENGGIVADGEVANVVDQYLQGTFDESGKMRAVSQNGISVLSYKIESENGEDIIFCDRDFSIEILVKNDIDFTRDIDVSMVFKYETGEDVFLTSSIFQEQAIALGKDESGRFKIDVPKNLLNVGMFSIDLLVVEANNKVALRENDYLQINVSNSEVFSKGWIGKTRGSIKPNLTWHVSKID
ncbi:MAG: ABC transporter ATP-binding protein [Vicingaceae bacterium]